MIERDGAVGMSFIYYYGSTHTIGGIYGEKSAGLRSDGTIKTIFSHPIL